MRLRFPRRAVSARRLTAAASLWLALVTALPGPAAASTTWSRNLWTSGAFLYQDPYYTACTAASTMFMLNLIALRGNGGPGFVWRRSTVQNSSTDPRDMMSILGWERSNDTLDADGNGSDAHGWRNALNYFGWGGTAWKDPTQMMYRDNEYASFGAAVKAAVRAIARYSRPVGILAWAGRHAQVMTGYTVTGEDPARSTNFTVSSIWLSDPLRSDSYVNVRISLAQLQSGDLHYRFRPYLETDSPYDDPYVSGYLRSSVAPSVAPSEWYSRWVIVSPIRASLPSATGFTSVLGTATP